jgi:hypothetical protein
MMKLKTELASHNDFFAFWNSVETYERDFDGHPGKKELLFVK